MKKLGAIVLSVVMLLTTMMGGLFTLSVSADYYTDSFYYTVSGGKATITGYYGSDMSLAIPTTLGGYSVTAIGNYAFEYDDLTSVVIPDSVTTIGYRAFYCCDSLTSVTIGKKVKSIGTDAFSSCGKLSKVYISDMEEWCKISFDSWESNPLHNNGKLYLNKNLVTKLSLPNTITAISDFAFASCSSLTSIVIGKNVKTIGAYAFNGCSKVSSVTIGDKVNSIGYAAFYGCDKVKSFVVPDSVTELGDGAVPSSVTSLVIGKGIESFSCGQFRALDELKELTIPFVGQSLYGMNYTHFAYIFGEYNEYNFKYKASNVPKTLTTVTVTGGLFIDNYAFYNCSRITKIRIGDGVKELGKGVFNRCINLKSVSYSGNVKTIGEKPYQNCPSLTKVYCTDGSAAQKSAKSNGISHQAIKTVKLYKTNFTYTGSNQKPAVIVKDAKGNTISSANYTVTYPTDRKNVGSYKVVVEFKGNYVGTKTMTYTISPVKTTVKATPATKAMKLTIGKKSTQVSGYQVQYSTSKSFSSAKSKTLSSYKTTSTTLTGLKSKTYYYIRVRTYKTVGDKKYYSDWSTVVCKRTN